MIYLESNMEAHIGYRLADTSQYIYSGKLELLKGYYVKRNIEKFIRVLEAIDNDRIKDNMQLSLCASEVIHLQNINLKNTNESDEKSLFHFDTNDISKHISIIDNTGVDTVRLVIVNDTEIYNDCHFSILVHRELLFDKFEDYITIFIDREFMNRKNPNHNKMLLRLIFACVDHFISIASKVTYDLFSEHSIVTDEEGFDINFCPKMIFRNRLTTIDIVFISEYLIFLCYYLRKWFRIEKDEFMEIIWNFPICAMGCDMIDDGIFDIIFSAIDTNLDTDDEIKKILDSEYVVAEKLRNVIMDFPYTMGSIVGDEEDEEE